VRQSPDDRRRATFCDLDDLRSEGSPNGLWDAIAGTNEGFEHGLDSEKIDFFLSQSNPGALYLRLEDEATPSPQEV